LILNNLLWEKKLFNLLLRYIGVGSISALLYLCLTTVAIEIFTWAELISSIAAFTLCMPVAYLGHRYGTFRAKGSHSVQGSRFVASMTVTFIVSSLSMVMIVNYMQQHYSMALFLTTCLVPVINFCLLKSWVFVEE